MLKMNTQSIYKFLIMPDIGFETMVSSFIGHFWSVCYLLYVMSTIVSFVTIKLTREITVNITGLQVGSQFFVEEKCAVLHLLI